MPSQYLAFQQLQLRFDAGEPILVAVVAPAGFGKSELIAAWKYYTALRGHRWEAIAVTGVAATQVGGATVHNFLSMSTDGATTILGQPLQRERLEAVQGIILDEAMMAEVDVVMKFFQILQELPLPDDGRRRKGALPLAGYRDLLFCGDVRQLPPASGRAPFWSTQTFQTMFEIFRLREDRRHERDPEMQALKELVAWGGTLPEEGAEVRQAWPVEPAVFDFVIDGYLRGWGLTADIVDLDLGTALFPRRADVRRWNEGRQTDGETDRQIDRRTDRETDGRAARRSDRQTDRRTARLTQPQREPDRRTERDRETARQTERQRLCGAN